MGGVGEPFRAGQAPLILRQEAESGLAAVEFLQGGHRRSFLVRDGVLLDFTSTHPQEQGGPATASLEPALLAASALGRLVTASGEYRRGPGESPAQPPFAVPVSMVILEALRRTHDVAPVLELLGTDRPFTRASDLATPPVPLAPLEAFVWDQLKQTKTLSQLRSLLPEQAQALARAFAGLACSGFLVPVEARERPAAAKPLFPPANPLLRERLARIGREGGLPVVDSNRELTQEELEQAQKDKEQALAMLAQGGDERQAIRLLTRAVSILPDPHSLVCLAEAEVVNPLWRERALAHLKQALEIDPKFTPAWLALANYWGLRGDASKQRRCLENILKYDPQNRDVREALVHLGGS
ncbi:MAG: hypothetical protein NZ869_01045 [Thermoanaerobaculum sp.]|nr:hypothetical protein [Thermoanaerobaculum sp.]MCX7895290.1 hypothetical protein [Thermoanaerobaculum sp.]